MRIGVPKEVKQGEGRVALTPEGARLLVRSGHAVLIETGAGAGAGFDDDEYAAAGASLGRAADAWASDLVVKVKEPLESEYSFLSDQILFAYLHLAGADPGLTDALLRAGTTAIAYETIADASGGLPLLKPMSAIAGSMAPLVGSHHLARPYGGRGVLVGEILGTRFGKVVVIGDGVVGGHAAKVAGAMGGRVLVFGRDRKRKRSLESLAPGIAFAYSTGEAIAAELGDTDLLIGGVLIQGARAPSVVSEEMVASMPEGAVIVDVSIDQGGCVATSRPTTHADPVFVRHGVVHYCVTNMPGAYPRTSTQALTAATMDYLRTLADQGFLQWITDEGRAKGVNTYRGFITSERVAEAVDRESRYRLLGDCTP